MATPRILVVDDQATMRDVITANLEPLGYEVRTVSNPLDVVDEAADWDPDLILLDVMMPGMSGIEVCRTLRERHVTRDVPVVMVTALTERKALLDALSAGADDFLTKPVDAVELRARVQSICRMNRYRQLLQERARVALLLDRASVATWFLDAEGCVVHANLPGLRALGVPSVGESSAPYTLPDGPLRRALMAAGDRARLRAEPEVIYDGAALGLQGVDEVVVSASTLADRAVLRADAFSRTRAADVELRFRHRERLVALGQLAASTAHELASVFTIVDVTAQQPLATAGSWDVAVGRIRNAAARGVRLVRALLAWSRPSRDGLGATPVDVLIQEVVPGLRALLPTGVEILVSPTDVKEMPLGRPDVEQVLLNLCVNSRDAGAARITVKLREVGNGVELEVEDDGHGISAAVRGRIGEAFVTSKGESGHGLGVWTVRRILEAKGGTLTYKEGEMSGTKAICLMRSAVGVT